MPSALADDGHRVGRELAAARAGARTGDVLERLEFLVAHAAGRVRANRLEHVLNGDLRPMNCPGAIEPP